MNTTDIGVGLLLFILVVLCIVGIVMWCKDRQLTQIKERNRQLIREDARIVAFEVVRMFKAFDLPKVNATTFSIMHRRYVLNEDPPFRDAKFPMSMPHADRIETTRHVGGFEYEVAILISGDVVYTCAAIGSAVWVTVDEFIALTMMKDCDRVPLCNLPVSGS